ncbi:MAG TPA: cobaltochelatase subunit CobN [Xanthobacteraceae bacterium]|nr:cobaltochelatase subunit CobN [Xanthobacteraceae bacterium]
MHLLSTSTTALDDLIEPIDLNQRAGDIAILSFADSDLAALAAAWTIEQDALPAVRLAHLRDLRHPMSVDLWIERVGAHARVILVRLLGGLDWWRYGVEQLSALAREKVIALAVLPGEDRDDPRLAAASTLAQPELDVLLAFFREGGRENLRALLRRLGRYAGATLDCPPPRHVPRMAGYVPGEGAVSLDHLVATLPSGAPVVAIVFYRALVLAADTEPIDAMIAALAARGLAAAPLFVTRLKEADAASFIADALKRLDPAVVISTTAFAAGGNPGERSPLDAPGVPVLQAIIASTKRAAWAASPRGLGPADLAMNVVLPELDGRVLAGAISFKQPLPAHEGLSFTGLANQPEDDRCALVADRAAALVRLAATPRAARRIVILMPDYAGAPGRSGYAVGLDVPASVLALLDDLRDAGYRVNNQPSTSRGLLESLSSPPPCGGGELPASTSLAQYTRMLAGLPPEIAARISAAWGEPERDIDLRDGAFCFRARTYGNVTVALPPDRGLPSRCRADYHDPALPPRHALLAFGLWLRHVCKADAIVHMGAHGTLEWLPGKAVALSACCFPEAVLGALPVFYPFIVSNPGEAAQAKRRIAAVTIGHLPPPLANGELTGAAHDLERLVDEYAQADGLDQRRRQRLAARIVDTAHASGLAGEAGIDVVAGTDEVLRRIDAWLCDLKDLAIKDGLHVYGRAPLDPLVAAQAGTQSLRKMHEAPGPRFRADERWEQSPPAHITECALAERNALLAALDGRSIPPGPAGSPTRGRRDVLPTGRNLYTADPRMLPTATAMDLGARAADEVIRAHLQAHGEMPRALVVDLWGSATLRTGGEEIGQSLAYLGCRPTWDNATGRVTGVEVLPTASIGRARIDVTWRISGLFRDLFPTQIALFDAAVQAVAAREEDETENPLVAARRAEGEIVRVFGTAPGAYGAGVSDLMGRDSEADEIGKSYLAATSHSYGGALGEASDAPGAFARRVADADLLVHASDDPGRDLLEGTEDVSFVGGFAAAAAKLGNAPDLVMLDLTDPQRPRARPLSQALARIVRARAVSPRFIAGQMRHGARGAAELAETVDRLTDFAQATGAVPSMMFDLLYEAYVADARVRTFLVEENPAAAAAIADRLDGARRHGFWHPRRNDIDADLDALRREARS